MKKLLTIGLMLLASLCYNSANAQAIVLDNLVEAGDLKLFSNIHNPDEYYYLSDQVRLAVGENGKPEFSFIRWVENQITDDSDDSDSYKDVEGAGGGIVTALIQLNVTDEQKREAEQELRRINPRGTIMGPVMYRGGTVALVSTFNPDNEDFTEQMLGLGPAPVLEGQKAAVSILLTKKGARILWESFKANIPDITFKFNMEIEGYNAPISADVSFDWEDIYEHKNFQAGVATPVLAADVDVALSEMISTKVIKIKEIGQDEDFDRIREVVMEMIQTNVFESKANTPTPSLAQLTSGSGSRPSMLDRASAMLTQQRTDYNRERDREERSQRTTSASQRPSSRTTPNTSSENTTTEASDNAESTEEPRAGSAVRRASPEDEPSTVPPYTPDESDDDEDEESTAKAPSIAIAASFQFKKEKKSGSVNISLEKSILRNQQINFDGNVGNIDCESCFHMFNLDDPLYKQREIMAFIDGVNSEDFGEFVNYVTVLLKKTHESGDLTQSEIRIDRKNFNKGNNFKFDPYGWKGDNDREDWLKYEYKTTWSFFGGHEVTSNEWIKRESGSITLAPPFKKQDIYIEVDDSIAEEYNARFAEVKIFYLQGEEEKSESVRIDLNSGELSVRLTILQQGDTTDFEYMTTWLMRGQEPVIQERKPSTTETLYLGDVGQFRL